MVGRSAPAGACVLRQSPNDNRRRRSVSTVPARLQPPVPRRARDSVAAAGRPVAGPGLHGRSHGEPGTPWPRPGGPWRAWDSMAGTTASPRLRGRGRAVRGETGTPWPRPGGPWRVRLAVRDLQPSSGGGGRASPPMSVPAERTRRFRCVFDLARCRRRLMPSSVVLPPDVYARVSQKLRGQIPSDFCACR